MKKRAWLMVKSFRVTTYAYEKISSILPNPSSEALLTSSGACFGPFDAASAYDISPTADGGAVAMEKDNVVIAI